MMDYEWIKKAARDMRDQTLAFRRHLHRYPELSFQEHETSQYVAECLTRAGILYEPVAGTGLLARIEGQGDRNRCVVLRADMDALPIQENSSLPFASRHPGVMHACGHDIHTACLLGAMCLLQTHRDQIQGTVFGLFQPGEELSPGGASRVLAEDPFRGYEVQAFIGEHVAPELPAGQLGLRSGKYMASSDEIRMTIRGRGGHAALPHLLADPVLAMAALLVALQQVASRNVDTTIPTVLSFGRVMADGATNVIPSEVFLEGTLRTMDETWRARALQRIHEIARGVGEAHGVQIEVNVAPGGYPCVVNDPVVSARTREVFAALWGDDHITELPLRMTAEDFGSYTQHYPSVFYRLGVGYTDGREAGGLHTPDFCPNEEALEMGVATLSALALHELARR